MKKGFVLIYTVIILGILLIIVGVGFSAVFSETFVSRDDRESIKAYYAADTGLECARYFSRNFQAFDVTSPQQTYDCGVGTFQAGLNPPRAQCDAAQTYNFTLNGFSNGACAEVEVDVTPVSMTVQSQQVWICKIRVTSNGNNSCTATGKNLVERTRWQDM
ncbi:hypothetical protein HYT01_03945 [Candidatus Giovannonibacteria bacterium]|nr:hypothetical protein [Candidatus Giovannonibacteria bacterium]